MAQPFKFGLVEDERVQLARNVRAGFEAMRSNFDSILRDRLRVEFARSYIVAELVELAARYKDRRDEFIDDFIKEAEVLIRHTRGWIHLVLGKNFAGGRTLLS